MIRYTHKTALLVVDMQNDFASPEGSLSVQGGDDLVPLVNAEIVRALAAEAAVVYTADWHPASTPHFAKDGGIWPVHCVANSWGAEFHPRLIVAGPTIRKGIAGEDGYSGFTVADPETGATSPTGMHRLLDDLDITDVVVVGLALDYCVKATALDARRAGLKTVLPQRLTAAVELESGDGARALQECRAAGVELA